MPNPYQAIAAYNSGARYRSQRDQEADVFRRANDALEAARNGRQIQRIRALADNRRLWMMTIDLMRDPQNALPEALRASVISVGLAVQREMGSEAPNFDFLIEVNRDIIAGLTGG